MEHEETSPPAGSSSVIELGGKHTLIRHDTDFSVLTTVSKASKEVLATSGVKTFKVASGCVRVCAANAAERDEIMQRVRQENVAHHIYQTADTGEEVIIADEIFLTLKEDNQDELNSLVDEYKLEKLRQVGGTHVLKVTSGTGRNPLKTACEIAARPSVDSCRPKILPRIRFLSSPAVGLTDLSTLADRHKLFARQWYLTTDSAVAEDQNLLKTASINVRKAWEAADFGAPEIVIAVIDDGFNLPRLNPFHKGHPVFRNKIIHEARANLVPPDPDEEEEEQRFPLSRGDDFHGTPVASIASAGREGDGMLGVAPGCTLLPLRIGGGTNFDPDILLLALKTASDSADVVNCSFSSPPGATDSLDVQALLQHPGFVEGVEEFTASGGRNHNGLVVVIAAGNDDAPLHLSAEQNTNGVKFARGTTAGVVPGNLPQGIELSVAFSQLPGVVVVGAVTSLKRKAGYSNWGRDLTIVAPSDNGHNINRFPSLGDEFREGFVGAYPGLGIVAAVNIPNHGQQFKPTLEEAGGIADFDDSFYTASFGMTSAAAAVVTGVVALIRSANDKLTAAQVIEILKLTADKDLDTTLDQPQDPNLKGFSGQFDANGHSIFFGAGKVDAAAAVNLARAYGRLAALEPRIAQPPT